VALLCSGGYDATRPAAAAVEEVVVVFKTHFDLGYTDMASNVVQRYRTSMIDDALKVVDRNRDLPPEQQFAWTLSGWPLAQIAGDWPGQTEERRRRVLEAFRSGRFVLHALPFTLHTETLEPEDVARGLHFSSRLAREASLELPRDAKMTDVPCHTWLLPTVLRRAGVDFLHLGCNAASRSPEVPSLFWWEGPDGSRLLTMYTAESYGTGLVPPKDWPYPVWLALIHTGDNHGPPAPEEVKQVLAEAAAKLPGVKVRIGRLSDFSDALLARRPEVPVVRGDMPDTWIHGPMCDPAGARLARRARPLLEATEALNTQLRLWGVSVEDASTLLAEAREQSLLYGEHTWGGALWWAVKYSQGERMPYGEAWRKQRKEGAYRRIESSWAEHTAYIERASALVEPLLQQQLDALAKAVKLDRPRMVVFNPLPWQRDGLVQYPSTGDQPRLAEDVPGLGYRTLLGPEPARARGRPRGPSRTADGRGLENRWFSLKLDPAGARLVSLVDRASGRELVDASAAHGFGQVLLERFSADDTGAFVNAYVKITADWATNELGKPNLPSAAEVPYRALTPADARVRMVVEAERAMAVMETPARGELPAVTTRWILPVHSPYVDLEVTVHDKPADPWPEALWIALPFAVGQPEFRLGRPGSVIDPARDIVPGANRHLFAVQTGVAVYGRDGSGVGLCPLDSPLVSLGEPGCWRFSREEPTRRPAVYVNLYNNQWTTNFRLWNGGTWTSRVRLWAFARYDPEAALVTPSLEARYPLVAGFATGEGGSLPTRRAGLTTDRKGMLVTAWGRDPEGDGLRLRLWEMAGQGGEVRLHLPEGTEFPGVAAIDLRGRPLDLPIDRRRGELRVPCPAFAPVTLRMGAR
jgi:hypothetical protein